MRKHLTIGVAVLRGTKAQRDKLSGILRFAATKPNWVVKIIDSPEPSNPHLDGQIILTGQIPLLRASAARPTVVVDYTGVSHPHATSVFIDNYAIGEMAADFFIRRRIPNIAAVQYGFGGNSVHSSQRIDGFAAAAAKSALKTLVYTPASEAENDFLCGSEAFLSWLRELPKPCGIFCFYDRQARDVLDCCRLTQLSIPNQVLILGVDNEADICEVTRPTLSSIQPDFEAAGHCAAKALDGLLSHRKVRRSYSYGILRLVERESTRPMNAGGRIVSAAIRTIQSNEEKPTVAGLARELHVSTTLLNRRFNEILGYGPKEEIDRQRLAKIKELLRDPSLSVTEVADLCHFAHSDELHHFFRRRAGLTPSQWRDKHA